MQQAFTNLLKQILRISKNSISVTYSEIQTLNLNLFVQILAPQFADYITSNKLLKIAEIMHLENGDNESSYLVVYFWED